MPDPITPDRACEILGVTAATTSGERHYVFAEKRAILEKKLGQSPTEGLKAKYRDAIQELERAFETLELAQTASDLGAVRPDLKNAAPSTPAMKRDSRDDSRTGPSDKAGDGAPP